MELTIAEIAVFKMQFTFTKISDNKSNRKINGHGFQGHCWLKPS